MASAPSFGAAVSVPVVSVVPAVPSSVSVPKITALGKCVNSFRIHSIPRSAFRAPHCPVWTIQMAMATVPETGCIYASRDLALRAARDVASRYGAELLDDTYHYNKAPRVRPEDNTALLFFAPGSAGHTAVAQSLAAGLCWREETRYYVASGYFNGSVLPEVLSIVAAPLIGELEAA